MTGRELTRIIEDRLLELNMSRGQFCRELGITSAAFSAWKNGSMPKPERIAQIEKCLGIDLSDYEKSDSKKSSVFNGFGVFSTGSSPVRVTN